MPRFIVLGAVLCAACGGEKRAPQPDPQPAPRTPVDPVKVCAAWWKTSSFFGEVEKQLDDERRIDAATAAAVDAERDAFTKAVLARCVAAPASAFDCLPYAPDVPPAVRAVVPARSDTTTPPGACTTAWKQIADTLGAAPGAGPRPQWAITVEESADQLRPRIDFDARHELVAIGGKVLAFQGGKQAWNAPVKALDLRVQPDGTVMVLATDGVVGLDPETGKERWRVAGDKAGLVAWDPEQQVVLGGSGELARIDTTCKGSPCLRAIAKLPGRPEYPRLDVGDDGAIAVGDGNVLRVLDASGKSLLQLHGYDLFAGVIFVGPGRLFTRQLDHVVVLDVARCAAGAPVALVMPPRLRTALQLAGDAEPAAPPCSGCAAPPAGCIAAERRIYDRAHKRYRQHELFEPYLTRAGDHIVLASGGSWWMLSTRDLSITSITWSPDEASGRPTPADAGRWFGMMLTPPAIVAGEADGTTRWVSRLEPGEQPSTAISMLAMRQHADRLLAAYGYARIESGTTTYVVRLEMRTLP